jgi:cysteine desulfurase/selenocysteine lyase
MRNDFPILQQKNRGKPLIYFDSASSAQKPQQVIDAVSSFYADDYANIHRGIYELSERATDLYEDARTAVANFIHAKSRDEIVFVKSATEGINLVADCLRRSYFKAGDEVLISAMEHHSNIVPWYQLQEQIGIVVKVIPITDAGAIDIEAYHTLFSPRTKFVALSHASNVLGTINPVKDMIAFAHQHHVPVLLDGAQAVPHMPVDMQDIDCDFYVFSGHKLYGPTGIGVLYAKLAWLDKMPPYQGGGGMIETVSFDKITFAKGPHKFEAGTPDIAGAVGLHAAIRYLEGIGMQVIDAHEQALLTYAEKKLMSIPGLRIIGTAKPKVGVISFVMDDIHPHDVGTVLDHEGIAIRAGHHCAMPLMERFNVPAMLRVSFGLYNTEKEIDALTAALQQAVDLFCTEV